MLVLAPLFDSCFYQIFLRLYILQVELKVFDLLVHLDILKKEEVTFFEGVKVGREAHQGAT